MPQGRIIKNRFYCWLRCPYRCLSALS